MDNLLRVYIFISCFVSAGLSLGYHWEGKTLLGNCWLILAGINFIGLGCDYWERKIKKTQTMGKLEPQKLITFKLPDEDFDRIKRGDHFIIECKHGEGVFTFTNPSEINWDQELKKL